MNFILACLCVALCADGVDSDTKSGHVKLGKAVECTQETYGHCGGYDSDDCDVRHGQTDCTNPVDGGFCNCKPGFCAVQKSAERKFRTCRQTCGSARISCNSEAELTVDASFICSDSECDKSECCIARGKCDGSECNPATDVKLKNATVCQGAKCTEVDCCAKRGMCENFLCPADLTERDPAANPMCKDARCMVDECCRIRKGIPEKPVKAQPPANPR
jgi:hypothetical protein